ncbi:Uncharacterised protein [Mycobacteroides abscessus subsp. abscessus]|nr:Uncharacterised protein [Mycobacteroides abscessus subsp. abscessus]
MSLRLRASVRGIDMMYVGVRCSMVTCSAASSPLSIDGMSVIAVAPLPITTMFLPEWS